MSDLISRAEVHKVLSLLATEGGKDAKLLFSDAHESIDNLPSVSADRPSGKWIRYKRCDAVDDEIYALMEAPKGEFFCNQCGKSAIKSNYCPNCGVKMKGGAE